VLVERGWAVYALDHRGHGATAASTGPGKAGEAGMQGLVDDLDHLVGLAAAAHPSVPVVLFGHSMGALIANAYAQQHGHRLVGLVLSGSPGADEGAQALADALREAADGGMADEPMPALAAFNEPFEPARTSYDWLSRDEEEVDRYVADPWCGDELPMTFRFVADLLAMAAATSTAEAVARIPSSLPVLLLTGEADPVSNGAANVRALEAHLRAAGLGVEAHYYPEARHEVLNETNRDEVHADLVAWLAARAAG
jgi:alpha-beta hydrolase superfamily lysophospholipase